MAVRKVHNSWWADFYSNRKRIRKKSPENSKRGAEAYEAVLRRKLAHGEPLEAPEPHKSKPFSEFADHWHKTYVMNNNKHSEIESKEICLRVHLKPFFGKLSLNKITIPQIEAYKAMKLKSQLAPKTINNHLIVLRKCLSTAVDWKELDSVPEIKWLRVEPKRIRYLTPIESIQLLMGARSRPMWHDMILLGLDTGMRLGELLGLSWEDIDLKQNMLNVRHAMVYGRMTSPKNNKARTIPLTNRAREMLLKRQEHKGFVFQGDSKDYNTRWKTNYEIHRCCELAGLEHFGWHTLRHTFASTLVQRGVSLLTVKELLGHSSIEMTMRYSHLFPAALASAIATLDETHQTPEIEHFGHYTVNNQQMMRLQSYPAELENTKVLAQPYKNRHHEM